MNSPQQSRVPLNMLILPNDIYKVYCWQKLSFYFYKMRYCWCSFIYFINMIKLSHLILLLCLILAVNTTQQIKIQYSSNDIEQQMMSKYLSRIGQGFFVDVDGYRFLTDVKSLKLKNWKGLIVQPTETKYISIKDFQPHLTVLNLVLRNVSGKIEEVHQEDDIAVKDKNSNNSKPITSISLGDLCQKHYQAKPTIIQLVLKESSTTVLESNNWNNPKCIPDIFYVQDGDLSLDQILLKQNYVKVDKNENISIYVYTSKVQFYKAQAKANTQLITNKQVYKWTTQFAPLLLSQLFNVNFKPKLNLKTHPAFVYISQGQVIDILKINNHSNEISKVGMDRPILILEYDQKKSALQLGTNQFTSVSRQIGSAFVFQQITAQYPDRSLTIYVFDHEKYVDFQVRILQENKVQQQQSKSSQPIDISEGEFYSKAKFEQQVIFLSVFVVFSLLLSWLLFKLKQANDQKNTYLKQPFQALTH